MPDLGLMMLVRLWPNSLMWPLQSINSVLRISTSTTTRKFESRSFLIVILAFLMDQSRSTSLSLTSWCTRWKLGGSHLPPSTTEIYTQESILPTQQRSVSMKRTATSLQTSRLNASISYSTLDRPLLRSGTPSQSPIQRCRPPTWTRSSTA